MMQERMKTSRLQPNTVLSPVDLGEVVAVCVCALNGDATVWPSYVDGGAGGSSLAAAAAEGS
jgi:hypothetical protein